MEKNSISTKQFIIFMAVAFGVAYIPLTFAGLALGRGNTILFTLLFRFVAVFIPFAAVLIARVPVKKLGYKIKVGFKKFIPSLIGAQLLSFIGSAIFLLIFKDKWTLSMDGFLSQFPQSTGNIFDSLGYTAEKLLPMMCLSSLAALPISQILPSFGEEAGWRGVMYPYLKNKLGKTKGRIVGGILWGVWHWPLILLGGHFFGNGYWGAPVLGPIAVCVSLTAFGILIDHIYEKTGSILMASLMHGGMNAAAVPLTLITVSDPGLSVFGPTAFGLISVIPVIIAAVIISRIRQ